MLSKVFRSTFFGIWVTGTASWTFNPSLISRDNRDPTDLSTFKQYTALGDSYAAGLGAGDAWDGDTTCKRYTGSYAAQLFYNDAFGAIDGRTFNFLACSGAVTDNVTNLQTNTLADGSQDLITVSAGGNDANLSTIVKSCIYLGNRVSGRSSECDESILAAQDFIRDHLTQNIINMLNEIKKKVKPAGIILYTGYGEFFNQRDTACSEQDWQVGPSFGYLPLTISKRATFNQMVRDVNTAISAAVDAANVGFARIKFVDWNYYAARVKGQFCEPGIDHNDPSPQGLMFFDMGTDLYVADGKDLKRRETDTTNPSSNGTTPTGRFSNTTSSSNMAKLSHDDDTGTNDTINDSGTPVVNSSLPALGPFAEVSNVTSYDWIYDGTPADDYYVALNANDSTINGPPSKRQVSSWMPAVLIRPFHPTDILHSKIMWNCADALMDMQFQTMGIEPDAAVCMLPNQPGDVPSPNCNGPLAQDAKWSWRDQIDSWIDTFVDKVVVGKSSTYSFTIQSQAMFFSVQPPALIAQIPPYTGMNYWQSAPQPPGSVLSTSPPFMNDGTFTLTVEPLSSDSMLNADEAKQAFRNINDGCDGDSSSNPQNYKYGGNVSTNYWQYSITPNTYGTHEYSYCNSLTDYGGSVYVSFASMQSAIGDFCANYAVHPVKYKDGLTRQYYAGTMDEMQFDIRQTMNVNDDRLWTGIDIPTCTNTFNDIMNGCQSSNNPLNWKSGGVKATGGRMYSVWPTGNARHRPSPPPAKTMATCDSRYEAVTDEAWMTGGGWASSDFGATLKGNLSHCMGADPSGWSFEYTPQTEGGGQEWTAHFNTAIWQKNCFSAAIQGAGGPNVPCDGTG